MLNFLFKLSHQHPSGELPHCVPILLSIHCRGAQFALKQNLTLIYTETGFDIFDPPFFAALKDIEYLFEHHKRHGNV